MFEKCYTYSYIGISVKQCSCFLQPSPSTFDYPCVSLKYMSYFARLIKYGIYFFAVYLIDIAILYRYTYVALKTLKQCSF